MRGRSVIVQTYSVRFEHDGTGARQINGSGQGRLVPALLTDNKKRCKFNLGLLVPFKLYFKIIVQRKKNLI